jgi:hypothetical protein
VRCPMSTGVVLLAMLLPAVGGAMIQPRTRDKNAAATSRRRAYKKSFGRAAIAQSAAGAGVHHLRNRPHEWGGGVTGYARRVGSGFGQHAVKETIRFGVGTLRQEDPRSTRPLKPKGFTAKLKDAVRNTFTVRRYGHRKRSVAAGNIAGNVGAGMVSRVWQPSRLATAGAGLESGGISIGAELAVNTAREFIPDRKKRKVRRVRARTRRR